MTSQATNSMLLILEILHTKKVASNKHFSPCGTSELFSEPCQTSEKEL